jgi:uncharacterized membrane protein
MENRSQSEIKRINGYLKEVVTFFDESGKVISHVINPLMVELRPRDITQIIVGALLVSSPLCFTEEVWSLSESLSLTRVTTLHILSVAVVIGFVYFNFYRFRLKGHVWEFFKRVTAIFLLTTITVATILFLIDKLPLETEPLIAYKRVIIIGFPAIFGATLSDSLK